MTKRIATAAALLFGSLGLQAADRDPMVQPVSTLITVVARLGTEAPLLHRCDILAFQGQ